jgi:phosphoribosyl-ATP pyrophosphohydrolase
MTVASLQKMESGDVRRGDLSVLFALADVLESRKSADPARSYTARLLRGDERFVIAKVVEEADEVARAAQNGDRDNLRYELADLWFHCLALMARYDVPLDEVVDELASRRGRSGLAMSAGEEA